MPGFAKIVVQNYGLNESLVSYFCYKQILNQNYMKAIWNSQVLAESNETIVIEGNHYFPPQSINKDFLKSSTTHTTCPWKGEASYYSLEVDNEINSDAAWYYPEAKHAAKNIEGYIAFWKGVEIVK